MAIRTWTGAGDGVTWPSAANWTTEPPDANNYPQGTDTAILDNTGSAIAGSDQTGIALDKLYVTKRFYGSLGSSGTPLTISANEMNIRGQGTEIWIEAGSVLTAIAALSTNAPNGLVLSGALGIVYAAGGRITIPSGTSMGNYFHVGHDSGASVAPHVVIEAGVTTSANEIYIVTGGHLTLNESTQATAKIQVAGGRLQYGGGDLSYELLTISGGVFDWRSGDLGTVRLCGSGFLEGRNGSGVRTLSSLFASDGAVADLRTGLGAITLTASQRFGDAIIYEDEV